MASTTKKDDKATRRAERLAELQRQAKAQERRRNLMVGGVVAAVLVLLGAVFYVVSQANNVDTEVASADSDYGVTIGPDDAPHQVVIYEDFLCPACGQLEAGTGDRLAELAADGQVQVDYRPFNLLGDYSGRATAAFGVVLEESGPEVAKEFHDLLFAEQPSESAGSMPDADWLVEKAVEAGADEDAVADGIRAGENDFSRGATQAAADAGIRGTPTVIVDGENFTSNDPAALLDAVED
ncbi:MAG: oxidoreductase [Nocardioides sp.]|nr:oxidoreductase [Nocardioides sp.]